MLKQIKGFKYLKCKYLCKKLWNNLYNAVVTSTVYFSIHPQQKRAIFFYSCGFNSLLPLQWSLAYTFTQINRQANLMKASSCWGTLRVIFWKRVKAPLRTVIWRFQCLSMRRFKQLVRNTEIYALVFSREIKFSNDWERKSHFQWGTIRCFRV